jgi:DNA excision repair protein ERCC-3
VESSHPETLQMLLKDGVINMGRVIRDDSDQIISGPPSVMNSNNNNNNNSIATGGLLINNRPTGKDLNIPGIKNKDTNGKDGDKELSDKEKEAEARRKEDELLFGAVVRIDKEDEEDDDIEGQKVHAFEIAADHVEVIQSIHSFLLYCTLLTLFISRRSRNDVTISTIRCWKNTTLETTQSTPTLKSI